MVAPSEPTGATLDTSGRVGVEVPVRAHLRRQRYGEGRQQERYVWIEGYAARRWVAPWSVRDVVAGKSS